MEMFQIAINAQTLCNGDIKIVRYIQISDNRGIGKYKIHLKKMVTLVVALTQHLIHETDAQQSKGKQNAK